MIKVEFYLKIDTDGSMSWIPLCRKPRQDSFYPGEEAIYLYDFAKSIGCEWCEMCYSRIPHIAFAVDEVGALDPPREINFLASRLYYGSLFGNMIHGPVVLFGLSESPESDIIPLSRMQLSAVSVFLGVPIPDLVSSGH